MAIEMPLWMDPNPATGVAPEYSARQDRGMIARLFTEGVEDVQAGNLAVTQRAAGANMSVEVAAGAAYVAGDDIARQGTYRVVVTSTETVTIGAAPASNSRIDLVVLRIRDAVAIGGTAHGATIEVIAGTAAASPAVPAVPNTAIPLAQVLVASGATSIVTANITDRRAQAGANTLKVGTQAEPMTTAQRLALSGGDLFAGRLVEDIDAGQLFHRTSASWVSTLPDEVRVATSVVLPAITTSVATTTYTVPLGATFRSARVSFAPVTSWTGAVLDLGTTSDMTTGVGATGFGSNTVGVFSGAAYIGNWNNQTYEILRTAYLSGTNLIFTTQRYWNSSYSASAITQGITLIGRP